LSLRTRQRPSPTMNSELNFFAGALELRNTEQEKHGWSSEVNGRFRQAAGVWFVNELTGRATASQSRVLLLPSLNNTNTHDLTGNLNGNMSLFNSSRVGFRSNYSVVGNDVGQPNTAKGVIERLSSNRAAIDGALRTRLGP